MYFYHLNLINVIVSLLLAILKNYDDNMQLYSTYWRLYFWLFIPSWTPENASALGQPYHKVFSSTMIGKTFNNCLLNDTIFMICIHANVHVVKKKWVIKKIFLPTLYDYSRPSINLVVQGQLHMRNCNCTPPAHLTHPSTSVPNP